MCLARAHRGTLSYFMQGGLFVCIHPLNTDVIREAYPIKPKAEHLLLTRCGVQPPFLAFCLVFVLVFGCLIPVFLLLLLLLFDGVSFVLCDLQQNAFRYCSRQRR